MAAAKPAMAWIAAAAGGALAVLATVALLAPAQWAGNAVRRVSGGRVELAEASGTIWNGSATLGLATAWARPDAPAHLPHALNRRPQPPPPFAGRTQLTPQQPAL